MATANISNHFIQLNSVQDYKLYLDLIEQGLTLNQIRNVFDLMGMKDAPSDTKITGKTPIKIIIDDYSGENN